MNIDVFDLPLWSAPFGNLLLERVNYHSSIKKILDIGTGYGFPLLELSQRFGSETQLLGIDIDDNAIQITKNKIAEFGISNTVIEKIDAESLTFDNNFFDLIVSNNGINNVDNTENAIKEASRVAKIGSEFVFTFNLYETYSEFYSIFNKILKQNGLIEELRKVEKHRRKKRKGVDEYKRILTKYNYKIIRIDDGFFNMSYKNEKAFFEHYFIKKYFLPEWKNIIPTDKQKNIIEQLKNELHTKSKEKFINFGVPFVCITSKKI